MPRRSGSRHLRELFRDDPGRFGRYSVELDDLLVDFSKQRIDDETRRLLLDLAREVDLEGWRDRMFAGAKINTTEDRAVLHVALGTAPTGRSWSMARMSCPASMPCWRICGSLRARSER